MVILGSMSIVEIRSQEDKESVMVEFGELTISHRGRLVPFFRGWKNADDPYYKFDQTHLNDSQILTTAQSVKDWLPLANLSSQEIETLGWTIGTWGPRWNFLGVYPQFLVYLFDTHVIGEPASTNAISECNNLQSQYNMLRNASARYGCWTSQMSQVLDLGSNVRFYITTPTKANTAFAMAAYSAIIKFLTPLVYPINVAQKRLKP